MAKEKLEAEHARKLTGYLARWTQPQRVFVIVGLVFGTALLLVVPPFQVPDEPTHFLRAYQISEGQWVSTWRNNVGGGMLPMSIEQIWQPFAGVRHNLETTSWGTIAKTLRIPLRPDQRGYYTIANSSSYSPIIFLPQATAIALGRMLEWPPLVLMYLGRLANLSVWIGLGYFALRTAPEFGRALLLLMLMPMSLFQAASLSPDAVTNGLAFVVTALVFGAISDNKSRNDSPIRWRWITLFVLSASALSLTKAAYLPLAAMILLVPAKRFGTTWRYAAVLVLTAAMCVIPLLLWARQTPGLDMAIYQGPAFVSARHQAEFLKAHPITLLQIPFLSAQRDGWLVILSFVGRLGWLNIQFSPLFVFLYLAALFFSCRPSVNESISVPLWRVICVVTVVLVACIEGVLLLNDLFWTSVGGLRVDGLQGRYFIPIVPALLLFISLLWRTLPPKFRMRGSETRRNAMTAMISLISCIYMLLILYFHYYVWVGMNSV